MNLKNLSSGWFTLIEILVSITIFSIILVSVFQIYITATDINAKTDITRAVQQNIKSSIEKIAEDIRKNGFDCVQEWFLGWCNLPNLNETILWNRLKINWNTYGLWQKSWTWYVLVDTTECDDIIEKCTLVYNRKPIMNSWVDVKDIQFYISDTLIKKLTIVMTIQPAQWKWIKSNLIKDNRFYFQTTISERTNLN
jgi:type II secretory pathway pseudopilin PulG